MITTSSASCAISVRTWLETSTVRPSCGERAEQVAQPADALRVEPVRRLVEHEHLGVAEQRARERRAAASSRASTPLHGGSRPRSGRRAPAPRRRARRRSRRRRDRAQVVATRAARMERVRLEDRADRADGICRAPDSGARAPSRRRCVAWMQRHERAQRRRLACPVRAEEAGDAPGLGRKERSSTATTFAVPLC